MGTLVLNGATSGSTTIQPTDAATVTATLPGATGTIMVSGNMPAFSAYQTGSTALSGSTWTKVQFQAKEYDTASAFDNTTNYRFQPTVAGYYNLITAVSVLSGAGTAEVALSFYKNGSSYKNPFDIFASNNYGCGGSCYMYMNGSTDYAEVYLYIGTTGKSTAATQNSTWFQGTMVRGA